MSEQKQEDSTVPEHTTLTNPLLLLTLGPPDIIRFDGRSHWPAFGEEGRCLFCKKNTTESRCEKCEVNLCINENNCYLFYHTLPHDPPDAIRYDRTDHWPTFGEEGRCQLCKAEEIETSCRKCEVHLCINEYNCYLNYHTIPSERKNMVSTASTTTKPDVNKSSSDEDDM